MVLHGLLALLHFPWFYLVTLLLAGIQHLRQRHLERATLGIKVTRDVLHAFRSIGIGLLAGIVISAVFDYAHIPFSWQDGVSVWVLGTLFSVIDMRLACVSYGGSLVALAGLVSVWWTPANAPLVTAWLRALHPFSLLALIAAANGVEGIATFMRAGIASPFLMKSRRGQIVGAFLLQGFWPLPIFVLGSVPFSVLPNRTGIALGTTPQRVFFLGGVSISLYAFILAVALFLLRHSTLGLVIVTLISLFSHVWIDKFQVVREESQPPLYVRPKAGVRILAILPGTPARRIGLMPGETIARVGGITVNSPYDLHFAIDHNPAYVKLEVIDSRGELRLIGTPIFERDPHHLGCMFVPDERGLAEANVFSVGQQGRFFKLWRSVEAGENAAESPA
ncbi:PDZ domain-containing protein [Ferroacidibacillus organovorans]|uniref:PDZ domain-containing protein n=1 Tax=Ferroacidibacillus organovorans TaxID=1765683 RepID=A0A1V4EXI8_9BACL|nr:PDZ domain-containing protein [Ferroacidibacillus organovorans]OPG17639.1 hypothetical protein B2M26_00340 [Ferroacidibacillus organovorans]